MKDIFEVYNELVEIQKECCRKQINNEDDIYYAVDSIEQPNDDRSISFTIDL